MRYSGDFRIIQCGGGGISVSMSFSELRAKEVIRLCDAEDIGCVSDLLFDPANGGICALCVVPSFGWGAVFSSERTVIPWAKIRCIGRDTILVDVRPEDCCCRADGITGKRKRFFRRN